MRHQFLQWHALEALTASIVEPDMKTKYLFGLVAVLAVIGVARPAHAGISVHFTFGLPVPVFTPPRAVVVTPCPPPVVRYPPPVVRCPPVVVVPAPPRYVHPDRCRVGWGPTRHGDRHGWSREKRNAPRGRR